LYGLSSKPKCIVVMDTPCGFKADDVVHKSVRDRPGGKDNPPGATYLVVIDDVFYEPKIFGLI